MPKIYGNRAETGGADLLSRFVSVVKTISCREVRAVLGEKQYTDAYNTGFITVGAENRHTGCINQKSESKEPLQDTSGCGNQFFHMR